MVDGWAVALSLLVKPVSGRCDLACTHCYCRDLGGRRATPDYGRMSPGTASLLIERAIEDSGGFCRFAFQGGEPTLAGLDFYRAFVAAARRLAPPAVELAFAIQTNGMAIDREWARFLKDEGFLVGLSLDGPRLLHDRLRTGPDGGGSHSRVMETVRLLADAGTDFNILCVVDQATADNARKVYGFFRRHGLDWIQFIPRLDPLDAPPGRALTAEAWGSFLKTSFDLWYDDLRQGRQACVRHFENYLSLALGLAPDTCAMSGRCSPYFAVEADGSVFPCDFYELDEWLLGNIRDRGFAEMGRSETARRFIRRSEPLAPGCAECPVLPLCRGGCAREREPFTGGRPSPNRLCKGYRDFLSYAGSRIMALAQESRGLPESHHNH